MNKTCTHKQKQVKHLAIIHSNIKRTSEQNTILKALSCTATEIYVRFQEYHQLLRSFDDQIL